MEKTIFEMLATHGITGVMLFVVGWAYYRKDKELAEERLARIADSKQYTASIVAMNERMVLSADKLTELNEELKKREEQRVMVEQATVHAKRQSQHDFGEADLLPQPPRPRGRGT